MNPRDTLIALVLVTTRLLALIGEVVSNSSPQQGADFNAKKTNKTSIEENIIDLLFQTYKKHERPSATEDQPTLVMVYMKILSITSINVIEMEYTVDMYLRQKWKDPRLKWKGLSQFSEFTRDIDIPSKKDHIWLPDLFFRNGKRGYVHSMTQPNYLLRLSSDGTILYSQKVTMKFACQMHLQNFPMDTQTCKMDIGSYGYRSTQLKFYWRPDQIAVVLETNMQVSEFNTPDKVNVIDCTKKYATSTGSYSCLHATFSLQRQLSSYIAGNYIPSVLCIMVSWLSFWISVDAVPARVTLGLLTLLGILTQGASLMSSLPRVSYIKAIDIWMNTCIIFVIGALMEFAVASILARRKRTEQWQQQVRSIVRQELVRLTAQMTNQVGGHCEELETLLANQVDEKRSAGENVASVLAADSEVDAYSRFLFPACFILYNCFYWLYYLVLVHRL